MAKEFVESRTEMEEFLKQETIGWLGMSVDGKPYVVPLNYAYIGGKIYFHCALEGKKLDAIRANPDVCFAVGRQEGEIRRHRGSGVCHPDNNSVLCFGRARILENIEEKTVALNAFNRAFEPNAEDLPAKAPRGCGIVEIVVREMTGRRELARKRTMWQFSFPAKE
jgi:uncharacterized protein